MAVRMSVPAQGAKGDAKSGTQRVLLYRLGSLGDMLVALPALHLVQQAFPSAERRLLTNFPVAAKAPAAQAVLGGTGLVHGYERYTVGTRNPLHLLQLAWRIRRWKPEALVYLVAARGAGVAERDRKFFRWACGIRKLIGVPLTEDMQRNLLLPDGTLETEASRLVRNIRELGTVDLDSAASWDMGLLPAELIKADDTLQVLGERTLLAVSVGTKVQSKDWGRDNWRALLARLPSLYPGAALVLMGAPNEVDASEFAAEGWRAQPNAGPVLNLCGALAPRESAAALRRCAVFLGHDSGPMHMAACVQTPCVAIFAARNIPRVWFPFGRQHRVIYHRVDCAGCELEMCVEQRRKCLLSITVDEVLNALRDVLPSFEHE